MAYNYTDLRDKYKRFIYHSFSYDVRQDGFHCAFNFEIEGLCSFTPSYFIPAKSFLDFNLKKTQVDLLVFHIGMVEVISYWKSCCCPCLVIKPAFLDEKAILWWKNIYFQGLGEFFYLNGIECSKENFMEISNDTTVELPKQIFDLNSFVLLPVGGGKDSVVTMELIKNSSFKVIPFIINPRGATLDCVKVAGYSMEEVLVVKRSLDRRLLDLNAQGFLNGHTPFSAMLAFVSLLSSAFAKTTFIALSNEGSANESTVLGAEINHQYSKSYEFERDFRAYCQQYISDTFDYFSFLRPLHEIGIVRLFVRYPQYFEVFKSCNAGSKTDIWCGYCPKCLFAFIILAPFISSSELYKIFGSNLLNEKSLEKSFGELIGLSISKPFECVGTVGEVIWALHQIVKQGQIEGCLLDIFKSSSAYIADFNSEMILDYSDEHFLPPPFEMVLKNALDKKYE